MKYLFETLLRLYRKGLRQVRHNCMIESNKNLYYSSSISSIIKLRLKKCVKIIEELVFFLVFDIMLGSVFFYTISFQLTVDNWYEHILWEITNDLSKYCLKISRLWQKIGVEKFPFFFCCRWQVEIFAHIAPSSYWFDIIVFFYESSYLF